MNDKPRAEQVSVQVCCYACSVCFVKVEYSKDTRNRYIYVLYHGLYISSEQLIVLVRTKAIHTMLNLTQWIYN